MHPRRNPTTESRLLALENERTAGQRVIREYGGGVCLIQGSYAFYDDEGRPLRERPEGEAAAGADEAVKPRDGAVHTVDYYGTGFLVDRDGRILTNRHVAEPWWNDETAERLADGRLQAALRDVPRVLPAPGGALRPRAPNAGPNPWTWPCCAWTCAGGRCPCCRWTATGTGAVAGQPVVVIGYPTGLEAILAKAESGVVKQHPGSAAAQLGARHRGLEPPGAHPALDHPGAHRGRDADATSSSTRPRRRAAAAGRSSTSTGRSSRWSTPCCRSSAATPSPSPSPTPSSCCRPRAERVSELRSFSDPPPDPPARRGRELLRQDRSRALYSRGRCPLSRPRGGATSAWP